MAEGADAVPEWETQRHEITNITKKPLQKEDTWCLIDNKWYKQWKKYVGFDSWETSSVGVQTMHPGPIDNSPILREDGSDIKDHLIDELDYVLVPQEGWDLLIKWYGVAENQNCIARKVVEYGMFVKHCKVEVYLLEFKLCQNNDLEHCITRKFSKADTIGFIEEEMRTIFEIPPEKPIRLWNRYSSNTYEHLNNKESTVQDAGLYQGQILIIEPSNDDGTWQRQVKSTSAALTYTNSSGSGSGDNRPYNNPTNTIATRSYGSGYGSTSYNYDYQGSVSNGSVQPGLCGLSNLGNTCFMNSALQCMSNTPPLTEYFLENHYWKELNVDNPLGMHGEIAKSYGDLVKLMWSGRSSYTMPRHFKTIVGRFAPQFSGYAQQDCQELMAFLLDGLHEDLNQVKKKPYVELKDAGNRPDEDVSKEAWANYQMRNNSIIVDIFHGLLKSTLVCPECSKISVTFDPFCYLSLPLPVKKDRQIEITLVNSGPENRPIQMKITVSKLGIVQDLCDAISRVTSIPATNLIVADVYSHKLHKIFDMDEGLSSILDRDAIFVYENPLNVENEDMLFIPVYLRLKRWKNIINGSSAPTLFAQPYFVPLPSKNCTYEILYSAILRMMMRFVRLPETKEDWDFIGSLEECHINGEVEMTNGDDCDSDPGEEEKEEMEELDNNIDKALKGFFLFSIQSVNSSGTVEVDKVVDEDGVVKLSKKTYLAAEFYENIKERFLDDKEAVARTVHESVNIRHTQKKQVIQLSECLELFTTTEKLGADDPWYCPFCKKHQQATKKFDLWQLPKVLIIHLKRFSYNRYWRDKLDTLVEFPINGLNMAKYVINQSHGPATYDLIAVANHYGGMGGGHYTAYGKNKTTGSWYYFDDSSVTNSSEDNVVSKAAYVLFYMRRDARDTNSSIRHANRQQTISAALGAPHNNQGSSPDEDGASSSDEDCSMDVN